MNLKERKDLETRLEKEDGKSLAKFNSWRMYFIYNSRLNKSLDYLNSTWSKKILKENDEKVLIKKYVYGVAKTFASYPLILGSMLGYLITKDPVVPAIGVPLSLYFNLKGEVEFLNAQKRMKD